MNINELIQIVVFILLITILTPILGNYMFKVFTGQLVFLRPVFGWLEKFIYRFSGTDPLKETNWKKYATNLLVFNVAGFLFLFLIQLLQHYLPLNPSNLPHISTHLAFNTAVSFVTNTNWQSYAGETTISYFIQLLGLTVQNFLSAATGIAVLLALTRGLIRKNSDSLGNFMTDMTRSVLYVLLPLSIIMSVILLSQGVIQNFDDYKVIHTLEGQTQVVPMGPVASQISIKQLGTNGGGYFNSNSSHPFENPTPLTNFLELLFILLIPAALTYTYGKMTNSVKHGWIIFSTMMVLFIAGLTISLSSELSVNEIFGSAQLMEGKETRFGIVNSILWSTSTTAASNGSVNAMHDSLTPIAGMVAMFNIMLGEIIFGGVGAGLYGMIIFIILTVFIAGLMIGRTPEYLGKKIEGFEVKMAITAVLAPSLVILIFSGLAVSLPQGISSLNNDGPHGLSEILYAFSSAAGNNGSAFAGLNANVPFYNIALGLGMLIGRYGVIIPVLAIAGSMAPKVITPESPGTFKTNNILFIGLLIMIILILGGLTFFPVLSLGPLMEHLIMIG